MHFVKLLCAECKEVVLYNQIKLKTRIKLLILSLVNLCKLLIKFLHNQLQQTFQLTMQMTTFTVSSRIKHMSDNNKIWPHSWTTLNTIIMLHLQLTSSLRILDLTFNPGLLMQTRTIINISSLNYIITDKWLHKTIQIIWLTEKDSTKSQLLIQMVKDMV